MTVLKRVRKRDGATVYSIQYKVRERSVKEKVGAVKAKGLVRDHTRMERKALAHLEAQHLAVENGTWIHPRKAKAPDITLGELAKRFLRDYRSRAGRISYYEYRVTIIRRHFGDRKLAARISVSDVDRFKTVRSRKVGPSTVRKDLASLSLLFRWAKVRGLVQENPAEPDKVNRPSEPRHRTGYLSAGEESDLLAVCEPWLSLAVEWGVATGMDRAEILGLSWPDLDEEADIIHAPRGKTGVRREIPIFPETARLLRRARKLQSVQGHRRVFLGPDGKPIHAEAAKTALRRAYEAAGVQVAGPWKILRHTFASRAVMRGVPLPVIAKLMGHTTHAITERYAHLSPDYVREAMRGKKAPEKPKTGARRGAKKRPKG